MCPKCGSEKLTPLGSGYICLDCKTLWFKDQEGNFQEREGHCVQKSIFDYPIAFLKVEENRLMSRFPNAEGIVYYKIKQTRDAIKLLEEKEKELQCPNPQ